MSISSTRLCNKCTKDISHQDCDEDAFRYVKDLGYGSIADGSRLRIDLCNICLTEIISTFKINPLEQY